MASISVEERRKLDPLSLPDPRAFSRWREKQKTLAQHTEERTFREEKVKLHEALHHPDLSEEQRVVAMDEAIEKAEAATGLTSSGVHEYWLGKTGDARDLLKEQLACKAALRGGIKAISKFRLRRALKRAHDAKLSSANCAECAEAKDLLQLLQRDAGESPYSSGEDVPKMTEEEIVAFRLQFHEADYVPDTPSQPKPLAERVQMLRIALESEQVRPMCEVSELLYLEELRDSTQFDDPAPGWAQRAGWAGGAPRRAPHECFGVTVFFNQFNGAGTLTELCLEDNRLTGPLPQQLGECCPSLQVLRLARNRLSGMVPASICKCKSLREVDLSSNALYGPVPADMGRCLQLATLILNHNRLSGALPPSMTECRLLSAVGLKSNFFTDEQKQKFVAMMLEAFGKRVFVSV